MVGARVTENRGADDRGAGAVRLPVLAYLTVLTLDVVSHGLGGPAGQFVYRAATWLAVVAVAAAGVLLHRRVRAWVRRGRSPLYASARARRGLVGAILVLVGATLALRLVTYGADGAPVAVMLLTVVGGAVVSQMVTLRVLAPSHHHRHEAAGV